MKPRVENAHELIWEGQLHLGDEPGIYGNAPYVGLSVDLPVTLGAFDPAGTMFDVHFELLADRVKINAPYTGHRITVFACTAQPGSQIWTRTKVGEGLLDGHRAEVAVRGIGAAHHIVRLEVDPDLPPGLYNDFWFKALSLMSTTHYADFGFRYI